ncbi:MAG: hypothetical protein WAK57_12675 [Desulfobacterales bacterium]
MKFHTHITLVALAIRKNGKVSCDPAGIALESVFLTGDGLS